MLERYVAILEGRAEAKYRLAKSYRLKLKRLARLTEKQLWQEHAKVMDRFKASPPKETSQASPSLLDLKAHLSKQMLTHCHFCERRCGANRAQGETGYCGVRDVSYYSSEFLHLGEEPELVPSHTIFFSGCTFSCIYCQNWDIATAPQAGLPVNPAKMARVVAQRHLSGARNVNFVGGNPDPNLPVVLEILKHLKVNTPVVWNSNMYASLESMALLDGVVDIYLGDFRYGNDSCAQKYSDVKNYWDVLTRNFRMAYDQAEIMLRHLVLPGHLECCTKPIMEWVAENIGDVYFNLMFQYYPCYKAAFFPELNRRLSSQEKSKALELAEGVGIRYR